MDLIGYLLIGVLLCQSILGLAILFDAILKAGLKRRQTLMSLTELLSLAKSWHTLSSTEQERRRQRVQANPLAPAFAMLVDRTGLATHAEHHVHRWLQSLDGNATHLKMLLVKTAPLIGLAGTLAGIASSMGRFEQRVSDPGVIVHGFSVAIETTLYGIFVTCFCLLADRIFWKPLKDQARELWLEVEMQLAQGAAKKSAAAAAQSAQVGRRKTDKRQSSEALKRIDQPGTQDDRRRQLHGRLESAVSLSQPIQAELRDASDIELPVSIHDRLLTDADIRATKLVCSD